MRFALAAPLVLCACAPAPRMEAHSAQAIATCQARGGTIGMVGLSTFPSCLTPYPDAGRSCGDSAQCEGRCLAVGVVGPGRTVSGQCEASHATGFEECEIEVRGGRALMGCSSEKFRP
jgi:hypothetical protein